jgi:predicted metal-dependent HD superfamily phosphohydrolase
MDRSILGARERIYDRYEQNIRWEYIQVPWLGYRDHPDCRATHGFG